MDVLPVVPIDGPIAVEPAWYHFVGERHDLGSVHDVVPSPVDVSGMLLPTKDWRAGWSQWVSHFLPVRIMPVARKSLKS